MIKYLLTNKAKVQPINYICMHTLSVNPHLGPNHQHALKVAQVENHWAIIW